MSILKRNFSLVSLLVVAAIALSTSGAKADTEEQLAIKLNNPVAALISLPLQSNLDTGIGPENDGTRFTLNIQPVIPISLTSSWNIISRTILPVIYQDDISPGAGDQFGLGDVVQSFFLSPVLPTSGWIWGVGPVFLLPTATDDLLGMEKWGAGPTVVLLKQTGPWTYGALVNHIWSFAGDDDRKDISSTFLQPFAAYTTPSAWTFSLFPEATYDWEGEQWSSPIAGVVSKVLTIGGQSISIAAGARYWAEAPDSGPEGFGFRLTLTFVFPK